MGSWPPKRKGNHFILKWKLGFLKMMYFICKYSPKLGYFMGSMETIEPNLMATLPIYCIIIQILKGILYWLFCRLLKKRNIPKERAKELKQERRTLKNRGYAANCRVKRENEEKTLEKKNARLLQDINAKKNDIDQAKRETYELQRR